VENPYPFPLDTFQTFAFDAINKKENVLVTAKTGSGKTLVGEYQIKVSREKGKRVFYTTPIKSLTNQKFHDLKEMGYSVGIMTGDIKFCPDADIVVMTTEILCNLLFARAQWAKGLKPVQSEWLASLSLDNVDAIVFDEVHYFNNPERGKVWEECLMLLPPEINLILLSATIDQPEKLGTWLGTLKQRPVHLISTKYRIVPLVHKVADHVVMSANDTFDAAVYNQWLRDLEKDKKEAARHRAQVVNREEGQVIHKTVRIHSFFHQINELVREMNATEKLPALFFVFSLLFHFFSANKKIINPNSLRELVPKIVEII
jgi:antiviral helicase SKI2